MSDQTQMSDSEKKKEDWMNNKWRPMMGWLYMGVCAFDFVLFPIMWSLLQAVMHASQITQWQPLTLQGAGLFHIAMGAVLGIAALGRTQEKLAGANNGGLTVPAGVPTAPSAIPPAPVSVPTYTAPVPAPSYTAPVAKPVATPAPAVQPAAVVNVSSSGKPMPAPQIDEPL